MIVYTTLRILKQQVFNNYKTQNAKNSLYISKKNVIYYCKNDVKVVFETPLNLDKFSEKIRWKFPKTLSLLYFRQYLWYRVLERSVFISAVRSFWLVFLFLIISLGRIGLAYMIFFVTTFPEEFFWGRNFYTVFKDVFCFIKFFRCSCRSWLTATGCLTELY